MNPILLQVTVALLLALIPISNFLLQRQNLEIAEQKFLMGVSFGVIAILILVIALVVPSLPFQDLSILILPLVFWYFVALLVLILFFISALLLGSFLRLEFSDKLRRLQKLGQLQTGLMSLLGVGLIVGALAILRWGRYSEENHPPPTAVVVITEVIDVVTATPSATSSATFTPTVSSTIPTVTPTVKGEYSTIESPYGNVLVYIPATELQTPFLMGNDRSSQQDESPAHWVQLSAYWIDTYEITNAQYRKCNICSSPSPQTNPYYSNSAYDQYPVIGVDWDQAQAYCDWRGGRLPTEAQWEYAARGQQSLLYPWGDQNPTCGWLNFHDEILGECVGHTEVVGSYSLDQSPYGLLDMAGNVREWVSDFYFYEYYEAQYTTFKNPTGPDEEMVKTFDLLYHVIRGGAWADSEEGVRLTRRRAGRHFRTDNNLGFRCVCTDATGETCR